MRSLSDERQKSKFFFVRTTLYMSCTILSSFTFLANEYQHQELIIPPFHNILKTDSDFFKEIFACKQDWRKHGEKLRGVEDALWMLARVF